jgi:prepilin-type processing-associated H-X9-DG protein/prepilin-type N-terminal cleavage/methylation domain-containing protein
MVKRRQKAFTLVELLVVISIISLLVSMLMPALSHARAQAKSAVCLANLKRIGQQGAVYVNDNGVYPPVRLKKVPGPGGELEDYYHSIAGQEFRRKAPRWQWFLQEGLGPVINPRGFTSEEAFNESMKIDNKYWSDPAVRKPEHKRNIRNGAYGYNGTYLGNTRIVDGRMIRFPVRENLVRSPAGTIFAGDSRGGLEPHGDHSYWLDPPKKAKYGDPQGEEQAFSPNPNKEKEALGHSPVEARHNGKGNVSFCDGHAESMTLTALKYHVDPGTGRTVPVGRIDRSQASNQLWTGTGRDDPPGEYGSAAMR